MAGEGLKSLEGQGKSALSQEIRMKEQIQYTTKENSSLEITDLGAEEVRYKTLEEFISQRLIKDRPKVKSDNIYDFLIQEVQSGRGKYGRRHVEGLSQKLVSQMQTGEPLHFVVTAIAHKNPNPEISGGRKTPDIGELDFFLHLKDILDGVEQFYIPGATYTILTEGEYYYNNGHVFDVSADEIAAYESKVCVLAQQVAKGRIQFVSLDQIIRQFAGGDDIQKAENSLRREDYEKYISIMQKSITPDQMLQGITPEEMAKKYTALQKVKHIKKSNEKEALSSYLETTLGQNYIYCAITESANPHVLHIDSSIKPTNFPQHGIGYLMAGSSTVKVVPFRELQEEVSRTSSRAIFVNEVDQEIPFGYEKIGGRRRI